MAAMSPAAAHSRAPFVIVGTLAMAALSAAVPARSRPIELHVAAPGAWTESGAAGHADGMPAAPFLSVNDARDALRSMRPLPPGGARIVLHQGTHAPFSLHRADSGDGADRPVVVMAAPGERAVVSGGVIVPPTAFSPWSGGAPGVLRANLASLGVTTAMLGGMQVGAPTADTMDFGDCQHDKAELFFGGEVMTLARYPNKAADGTWRFLHADVAGKFGAAGSGGAWFLISDGANATRVSSWASKDAGTAWMHGYWEFDWADSYRRLLSVTPVTVDGKSYVNVTFVPNGGSVSVGLQVVKTNARFYGVNLLSELDAPGEYYIDENATQLYFYPPAPIASQPVVVSVNASAVITLGAGTGHVRLESLEVAFGRGEGVSAEGVDGVLIRNCTVHGVGTTGVSLSGTNSAIADAEVRNTGCSGVSASGGDPRHLVPGNVSVRGCTVHRIAQWKRTYQPAVRFGGSGNVYADNDVGTAPHTCMTGGGVNLTFTGNTLDTCCFESSDVGAFYVCGQGGTAFWGGRGGVVKNNTFRNIRNLDGTGVQGPSVQALYLDDQMSGWEIANNEFVNCMAGSFIGGGRDNHVHDNYYESCDLAQHFDNRGMGWEADLCKCDTGPTCDPAVASAIVADPASSRFVAAYPLIKTAVVGGDHICVPVNNVIENNRYCKVKKYLDATAAQIASWMSTARNNTEVHTC